MNPFPVTICWKSTFCPRRYKMLAIFLICIFWLFSKILFFSFLSCSLMIVLKLCHDQRFSLIDLFTHIGKLKFVSTISTNGEWTAVMKGLLWEGILNILRRTQLKPNVIQLRTIGKKQESNKRWVNKLKEVLARIEWLSREKNTCDLAKASKQKNSRFTMWSGA